MIKANETDTAQPREIPPHYQFDENRQTEMIHVVNALNGLAALIHDGDSDTARSCALEVPREDLAAIITVISKHTEATMSGMPFVRRTVN